MLHGIIDPGSKADIRPAYQPALPTPRLSPTLLDARRRSLVPATRGLRRWDQPFESSSIIELDTEPHRGVRRTLIRLLLSLISLVAVASRATRSTPLALPPRLSSARNFRGSRIEAPSKPTAFSTHQRSSVLHAYTFFHPLSEFLRVNLFCLQHGSIRHESSHLEILICSILFHYVLLIWHYVSHV